MPPVKRFLFDNRTFDPDYDPEADHDYDYGHEANGEEGIEEEEDDDEEIELPPAPTFSEEELAAAQQQSFQDGKAAGLQEANAQFEHVIATALSQIAQSIPTVFEQHAHIQKEHEAQALEVATAVSKKIIPAYAEKNGLEEIIQVVQRCMEPLHTEPRIIVKVHESLREDVQEKLKKIADNLGFEGRVVVMANDDIVPGDCRIDWSEGGAERNSEVLWQQIDEIIDRNLTPDVNQGDTPSTPSSAEPEITPEQPQNDTTG